MLEGVAAHRDSILWGTDAFRARLLAILAQMAPPRAGRPIMEPLARLSKKQERRCREPVTGSVRRSSVLG